MDALCGLVSFMTNSRSVLKIAPQPSPAAADVIASLISSTPTDSGIERVALPSELPTFPPSLSASLRVVQDLSFIGPDTDIIGPRALGAMRGIVESLGPKLLCLEFAGVQIVFKDGVLLGQALPLCNRLKRLVIRSCTIGGRHGGYASLAAGIAGTRSLESVSLLDSQMDAKGLEQLVEAAAGLPKIKELAVNWLGCRESVVTAISKSDTLPGTVQVLDLWFNGVIDTDIGLIQLADGFSRFISRSGKRSVPLRELTLRTTGAESLPWSNRLAEVLQCAPRLSKLWLYIDLIQDDAATIIGKAILAESLSEINVSGCGLGPEGAVALFGAIRAENVIRTLRAAKNAIEDQGAEAVVDCIRGGGCGIERLDLARNVIGEKGATELAKVLAESKRITELDLSKNELGPEAVTAVLDAISPLQPMDRLRLKLCKLGDKGAEAIGRLILRAGCRRVLIPNNDIHFSGVASIIAAVVTAGTPTRKLDLAFNPAGKEAAELIALRIINGGTMLEKLDIRMIGAEKGGVKAILEAIKEKGKGAIRRLCVGEDGCGPEGDKIFSEIRSYFTG